MINVNSGIILSVSILLTISCTSVFSQMLPEMIEIEGDSFYIGERDLLFNESFLDKPLYTNDGNARVEYLGHNIRIKDFKIGKYEVTVNQYKDFINKTGYKLVTQVIERIGEEFWDKYIGKDNNPMGSLTYPDMVSYCQWLSDTTGSLYRLPTEAEWEYMAKGDTQNRFPWGEEKKIFDTGIESNNVDDHGRHNFTVTSFPDDSSVFGVIGVYGGEEATLDMSKDVTFYLQSPRKNPLSTAGSPLIRGQHRGYWDNHNFTLGILKRNWTFYIWHIPPATSSFRIAQSSVDLVFNPHTDTECQYFLAKGVITADKARIRTIPNDFAETLEIAEKDENIDIMLRSTIKDTVNGVEDYWYRATVIKIDYTYKDKGFIDYKSYTGWIFGTNLKMIDKKWYEDNYSYLDVQ